LTGIPASNVEAEFPSLPMMMLMGHGLVVVIVLRMPVIQGLNSY